MKDERAVKRDLRDRTTRFALWIIRLCSSVPATAAAQVIARQVLRSGTSVGAHYREAHRARSDAEFISKIEGGLQELEETSYWLELLAESKLVAAPRLADLRSETEHLLAVLTSVAKNAKKRRK